MDRITQRRLLRHVTAHERNVRPDPILRTTEGTIPIASNWIRNRSGIDQESIGSRSGVCWKRDEPSLRRVMQDGCIITNRIDVGGTGSPDSAQVGRDVGSHLGPGVAIEAQDHTAITNSDDEVVAA